MKTQKSMPIFNLTFILLLLAFVIQADPSAAQKTDQTINFNTPRVELVFQPPLRSGFNSPHPLNIELPKLNLIVNLLENYIQYLARLQKVATGTSIKLFYAPDLAAETENEDTKTIRINEPGLNQILQQVNQSLKERKLAETTYLLDNADSLLTIPDQFLRKVNKTAIQTGLINYSSFQKSLEPDTDFCVVDKNRVVVARPFKRSNRLFIMTDENNVCSSSILLEQSHNWYANLSASANGKFMALTDGMRPAVLTIGAAEPQNLFSDENIIMLDMCWSPAQSLLAGMALNNSSQERILFLYDAEKGSMISFDNPSSPSHANYLNAFPYWSPDGNRIIFTSARGITLLDIRQHKIFEDALRLPNEIGELVWSADSNSFALLEVIGQARNRYLFDDLDYRKTVLHRYRINSESGITEDHAQRVESRNTIKLISFWTLDRILYLEGRLVSKRLNTPFWDLSKTFSAYLTPPPSTPAGRDKQANQMQSTPQLLPMQYLYVFRNLDGKYNNIYDAGFGHSNHLFTDAFNNLWFIGLRRPDEIKQNANVYSVRLSPYPFVENNFSIFSDISSDKMESLLKFLQDYNLRLLKLNNTIDRLFMLANFSGPLNLWSGSLNEIVEGLVKTEE
ncbi:MAG: hypothetical protein EOM80_03215 [Erysipelotrichia bacterium]|nr:hypothetical protein [Candidatus Riflebacteria bacterium]NCB37756.1 hypothetical protein [Erysipelotrichia bacterium]